MKARIFKVASFSEATTMLTLSLVKAQDLCQYFDPSYIYLPMTQVEWSFLSAWYHSPAHFNVIRRMRFLFVRLLLWNPSTSTFTRTGRSAWRRSETEHCLTVEWRSLHVAAAANRNFLSRRTDSFMSVLAVAFTETPKETVFTDPVNGVPFFYTSGSEGTLDL